METSTIITTIIGAVTGAGGGAIAAIKFLYSRIESLYTGRIEAMEKHIAKLDVHVAECEQDRTKLYRELINTQAAAQELKRRVDDIAPELT